MRARIWTFTFVVAIALAFNLARVSLTIAQTGEDTLRARVAAASTAFRGQLDLLDARLAPRAVAMSPDLIEAVRGGEGQPAGRPDERALRAAGAVLAPDPDLFAVVSPQGGIISRRTKPAQVLEDVRIPLAQTASGSVPTPTFGAFDGSVYRFAAARVPGATAAAVVGMLVDDRFAAQLKSQVDADVTLLQGGKILASSLPQGEERANLTRWAANPGPGYGTLQIRLPLVGTNLSGKLPRGANRHAVRGALIPLDGGVQAALTVPASPYLGWLGRYQALYLMALGVLVLFGFIWGLFARPPAPVVQQVFTPAPEPDDGIVSPPRRAPRTAASLAMERGAPAAVAKQPAISPPAPPAEVLDPDVPAPEPRHAEPAESGAEPVHGEVAEPALEAAAPSEASTEDSSVWGAQAPAPAEAATNGAPDWEMPTASPSGDAAPGGEFSFGELDPPMAAGGEAAPEGSNGVPHDAAEEPVDGAFGDHASTDVFAAPVPIDPLAADAASDPLASDAAGDALGSDAANDAFAANGPNDPLAAGAPEEPFPGDEPTRVEPISAALIDKLRERDGEPAPEGDDSPVTTQPFAVPGGESDPDEPHWRDTFDQFRELKTQLGEASDRISFDKFAAKLKKNRADMVAKHNCKGVRFSVYEKDGKAAIKASAIR